MYLKLVRPTCDKSNDASRLTIVKNGGELENEVKDEVGLGECDGKRHNELD